MRTLDNLPLLSRAGRAGVNLLFPPQCAFCQTEITAAGDGPMLCEGCLLQFAPDTRPRCVRCGELVPEGFETEASCNGCRGRRLQFDSVTTLGAYQGELRNAVLRMKRPAFDPLAMALGGWLADRLAKPLADLQSDLIVPVPMFWIRRARRGTNSPEMLAGKLSARLSLPTRRLLRRTRHTQPQAGLSAPQRRKNVRGPFDRAGAAGSTAPACCWSTTCCRPGRRAAKRPARCARAVRRASTLWFWHGPLGD